MRWAHTVPRPCPPHPVFPLCGGSFGGGVLCHKLHKDFSQTSIQGFLSCRVGRGRLPALPRILLWTERLGDGEILVASAGFQVPPPKSLPRTWELTLQRGPRGVWDQARHLPEISGLPPLSPLAVGWDLKWEEPWAPP